MNRPVAELSATGPKSGKSKGRVRSDSPDAYIQYPAHPVLSRHEIKTGKNDLRDYQHSGLRPQQDPCIPGDSNINTLKTFGENDREPAPVVEVVEKEPGSRDDHEASNDRPEVIEDFRAWLYVLAGFITYVNVSGTLNSFGVYQAFYQSNTLSSSSASSISWIGSIQVFLAIGFGVIAGPLYDRGFLRTLVGCGSSLQVFGLMMTSIADSYHQYLLAQGICVGLGMGLAYVPMLGEVSMKFSKRRPIALGLASTGACVGGVIYPVMIRQLIPKIGFGWTVRAVAFVNLGCTLIAFAIVCRRPNQVHPSRRAFDLGAFREMPFTFFTLGMFLVYVPYYVPLTYIPIFAHTRLGASDNLAGYLLSIVNAGSLLGRTVPYILNSRVTPIRVFCFWTIAADYFLVGWE
ncbi:MAG: hypothetical protein Q9203_000649 [Teloschistes exilis]